MTLLDAVGTEPQYVSHVLPAWLSCPSRGTFWTGSEELADEVRRSAPGEEVRHLRGGELPRPVLVGSFHDYSIARRRRAPRIAYMEHGAGQSYAGDRRLASHPAYAGGGGREGVGLLLSPNAFAALRWRTRYPSVRVEVIGATRVLPPPEGPPLLVVSFHWQGSIPELRGALPHYRASLRQLAEELPVAGHSHPRFAKTAERVFAREGVPFLPDLSEVAARATVYAVDNSSTLWELGLTRPVIALNAPWYRRDVDHGLRFWSHAGLMVDSPGELALEARRLLSGGESPMEGTLRVTRCRDVLPYLDGARRAGTLLADWLSEGEDAAGRAGRPAPRAGVPRYPSEGERVATSLVDGQLAGGSRNDVLAAR